jgi:hypothetical protein
VESLALQGLNFDAAALMAAEYQRVMKRARDLRQAELEEELATIKHDPTVLAGQIAITQCHESARRRLAPICGSRGLQQGGGAHRLRCADRVLPLQGATRRMQLQIELRGLRLIEVQAAMRTKVEMKQVGVRQQWVPLLMLMLASFDHQVCQRVACMLSHRCATLICPRVLACRRRSCA